MKKSNLLVTWHPTFAFFHNPYEWGTFLADLDRFARLVRGQISTHTGPICTRPKAKDVKLLHRNPWVAVDIETAPAADDSEGFTGKDPTRARLKTVGIANEHWGLSHWWTGGDLLVERAIAELLADPGILKVFHNGWWFDLRVLERYGMPVANLADTRDLRRALVSTSPLKLSYIGSLYTDYHAWKEDEEDDAKGLVFTDSKEDLKRYNVHDCIVTARCWAGMKKEPEWEEERVRKLYRHQMQLSRIAAEMHTTGIKVDKTMRKWMAAALLEEYEHKEAKLIEQVGVDGFECTPNAMRALIYASHAKGKYAHLGRFNLPDPLDPAMYSDPKTMETISVDEDSLILLLIDPDTPEELKDIIQLYWDAEEVWKKRSTFVVSKLVREAIGKDGRIRPGWNSCGTDTGRFACSQPNLMNVEKLLRAMYVAGRGRKLVGADYSQLELRVRAYVMHDPALEEDLATGDVYSQNAKDFFQLDQNLDVKKLKPKSRKSAKIIHLGKQYGAGDKKVFQIGLKTDRSLTWVLSTTLCRAFERRYEATVKFWEEEQARVEACGYSETRIMRRRRVYPRVPERTDTANYPIQGTAADIKNLALIRLDKAFRKYLPSYKIIADLHDAIYTEGPARKAQEAGRIVQECMEKPVKVEGRTVVFPVELGIEDRWSDFE